MATQNLDSADLKAVESGGLINEDVMQKIWDISNIPLPFTSRAGTGTAGNEYTEWTQDRLQDPDIANAKVDGQDTIDANDTSTGKRLGNHCQISTKTVQVSTRANESDTIGFKALSYQVMQRQKELKRDVEAISLTGQGSVEDDGDTVAGNAAGIFAFLATNSDAGAGGSVPGFNNTTKLVDPIVQGTARPLTETMVRDMCQAIYDLGGDPSVFMGTTSAVRAFSEYCFTSSARIATLTSETTQSQTPSTAKGAVNVFVTDFDVTLDLIPNRLMPKPAADTSNILIADFDYIELAYLHGYRVEPLAKTGLADKRQMIVDWTVRCLNEEACGGILDIDETAPVTYS